MPDASTYCCSPSVAATQVDDSSMVLLHLSKQTYFELNKTGTRLWQHADEEGTVTVAELAHALKESHGDMPRSQIRTDVESFVRDMTQAGLLVKE